jgi:hypothetical protein
MMALRNTAALVPLATPDHQCHDNLEIGSHSLMTREHSRESTVLFLKCADPVLHGTMQQQSMLLDGRLLDLMRTLFLGEMIGRLEAMRADVPNWTLPVPLDARVVMHGALANRRNPKQGREDER